MRALPMLVLVLLSGCALRQTSAPRANYKPIAPPDCDPDRNPVAIDAVLAAGSAGMTTYFALLATGAIQPSDPTINAGGTAVVLGGISVGLVVSALVGLSRTSKCRAAWAEWEPESKRRAVVVKVQQQQVEDSAQAEYAASMEKVLAEERAAEAARAEKQREEEAANLADAEALAKARAPLEALDGYQTARWGMSRSEILRLFPRATLNQNRLSIAGPVSGLQAVTTFLFAQNQLTDVVIGFERSSKTRSDQDLFEILQAALEEKYGPSEDEGVALGHARYWKGSKTEIMLRDRVASPGLTSAASIQYSSVALADLRERIDKKDL
jgi:hypothetical protein